MVMVKTLVVIGILLNFANGQGMGGGGFMRAFGQVSQELTPQQREEVRAIFMDPNTPKYITKQKIGAFFQRIGGNAQVCIFERLIHFYGNITTVLNL